MKKISSAATCTRKKGSECRIEIREPFGNGIVRYRGIEAIRQNPPLDKGALNRVIRKLRLSQNFAPQTYNFSLRVRLQGGQAQQGTGARK